LLVAYQLDLPPSWTIHNVFHASLLTPYAETLQHRSNFPCPPPEIIDGEMEFEVEAIKNHRFYGHQHKLQYLIGWKDIHQLMTLGKTLIKPLPQS
jgi:hypothetical protein